MRRLLLPILFVTLGAPWGCGGGCGSPKQDASQQGAAQPTVQKRVPVWPESGYEIKEELDEELNRSWVVIAWPPADDDEILAYRIVHEDLPIGEVTGDTTTFRYLPEDRLPVGRYHIIAVDADGHNVPSPWFDLQVGRMPPKFERARLLGQSIPIPGTDEVIPPREGVQVVYDLHLVEVDGVSEGLMQTSLDRRAAALSSCFQGIEPGDSYRTTIQFGKDGVGKSYAVKPAHKEARKCLTERARSVRFPAKAKKVVFDVKLPAELAVPAAPAGQPEEAEPDEG